MKNENSIKNDTTIKNEDSTKNDITIKSENIIKNDITIKNENIAKNKRKYVVEDRIRTFHPVWKSFFHPKETIQYVLTYHDNKRGQYIVLILLYGLLKTMMLFEANKYVITESEAIGSVILAPIIGIGVLYIFSWLLYGFGKIMGGVGTSRQIRVAILWSNVPIFLIISSKIATFLGGATNLEHILHANEVVAKTLEVADRMEGLVQLACYVNLLIMIAEVEKISKIRAFLTLCLFVVVIIILIGVSSEIGIL